MKDLIFAFLLGAAGSEKDALRLAYSIRTFGGMFCFNPIWLFSYRREEDLPAATRKELFSTGARLIPLDLEANPSEFPFADYVSAAGIAEGLSQGETSYLVLMATDTLVFQPPFEFLLPAGKSLGACPVHLKLLGSDFDEPVDEFWRQIYLSCGVDDKQVFPLRTIVDEQLVRAYFNAGLLVVRPERGILRRWQSDFERLIFLPEFEAFYQVHELYKIFMHQAVLAGSILSNLKRDEFHQLPFEMNYPLHLHHKVVAKRKLLSFSQLITCRYEDYGETFNSLVTGHAIQIDDSLRDWLRNQQ